MPADLYFTVEMNGKVYLRKTARETKRTWTLYVPPGVQEFRVTAKNGAIEKASNTVSTEFKSKKQHTLKIELRTRGAPGSRESAGSLSDTQMILTLR